MGELKWCKGCLNMSTRPRIEFNQNGFCNACTWADEKKSIIDWDKREKELEKLLSKHKSLTQAFDCIVPVSGGKDGSYVAYTLKERYGIRPLCVTVRPPLEMEIGEKNLLNFIRTGFDHIHVSPDKSAMQKLDTTGFKRYGQGYYGWLIAIHTAVLRIAKNFGISLIMYAEDGEIEYGGSTINKFLSCYGDERMKEIYLNDTYKAVMDESSLSAQEKYWFEFTDNTKKKQPLEATHLSYYEAWDPYRNYLVAKKMTGLSELEESSVGTFTNFAQNDQELASLHYYLMYLKFGFGRATQDAGIEIRRGAMSREQAKSLVQIYDNQPPIEAYGRFADYYQLELDSFYQVLESFVNRDLFESDGYGNVKPLFVVQ